MKTKNNLITGIIIGICLVVFPLILMSGTYLPSVDGKKNKFEITVQQNGGQMNLMTGFLLNTETGETWLLNQEYKTKVKNRQ